MRLSRTKDFSFLHMWEQRARFFFFLQQFPLLRLLRLSILNTNALLHIHSFLFISPSALCSSGCVCVLYTEWHQQIQHISGLKKRKKIVILVFFLFLRKSFLINCKLSFVEFRTFAVCSTNNNNPHISIPSRASIEPRPKKEEEVEDGMG